MGLRQISFNKLAASMAGGPVLCIPAKAVRKIIYTTNAIESLNRVIRKTTRPVAAFQPMPPPKLSIWPSAISKRRVAGQRMGCRAETIADSYPERFMTRFNCMGSAI